MEADNGIEVCKPSDKDFLRTLENAVRCGTPVTLENVLSALDPYARRLDPQTVPG